MVRRHLFRHRGDDVPQPIVEVAYTVDVRRHGLAAVVGKRAEGLAHGSGDRSLDPHHRTKTAEVAVEMRVCVSYDFEGQFYPRHDYIFLTIRRA